MDLLSKHILWLLVRRVNAVSVWPGLFPPSPAQPGLSARGGSCANRGIPEIGASSLLFYMETQRLAVWLVNFFFLPMHPRTWRGLEEDLGLLSACQGIFPDNSSFVGILGSEMGAVVLGSQPGVLGCIPTSSSTVGGWPEGSSFGGVSSAGLNRACPRVQCVCSSGGGGRCPRHRLALPCPCSSWKGICTYFTLSL